MTMYEVLFKYLKDKYDTFYINLNDNYKILDEDDIRYEYEELKKDYPKCYECSFKDYLNNCLVENNGCLQIGTLDIIKDNEEDIINYNKINLSKLEGNSMSRLIKKANNEDIARKAMNEMGYSEEQINEKIKNNDYIVFSNNDENFVRQYIDTFPEFINTANIIDLLDYDKTSKEIIQREATMVELDDANVLL